MTATRTTIRLDRELVDQAVEALGVKTRTEAVQKALEEFVAAMRSRKLLLEDARELEFTGYLE